MTTTYANGRTCHDDGTKLFRAFGTTFFGGTFHGATKSSYDLILNFSGRKIGGGFIKFTDSVPEKYQQWAKPMEYPVMDIDWPDMGAGRLFKDEWQQLADLIKHDDDLKRVYLCCVGGHGRTGTAAVILGLLLGALPYEGPITELRKRYCKNIVESKKQFDYIEDMTFGDKLTFTAEVTKGYTSYSQQGHLYTGYTPGSYQKKQGAKASGSTYSNGQWQTRKGKWKPKNAKSSKVVPKVVRDYATGLVDSWKELTDFVFKAP